MDRVPTVDTCNLPPRSHRDCTQTDRVIPTHGFVSFRATTPQATSLPQLIYNTQRPLFDSRGQLSNNAATKKTLLHRTSATYLHNAARITSQVTDPTPRPNQSPLVLQHPIRCSPTLPANPLKTLLDPSRSPSSNERV